MVLYRLCNEAELLKHFPFYWVDATAAAAAAAARKEENLCVLL